MVDRLTVLFSLCALLPTYCFSEDVITCSGNVRSESPLDYTQLEVQLLTRSGTVKEQTDCAPNNGYFLIPIYDKGEYILKVIPPQGWSFEPSELELVVDGKTDPCSREENIVFTFSGFPVFGQVNSKGLKTGPAGVTVQLKSRGKDGKVVREAVTEEDGNFVMTGIQVGEYDLIMFHSDWALSKEVVPVDVVKGTVQIPSNRLLVLGYDVKGQIQAQGKPVAGVQFLLYSDEVTKVDCGPSAVTTPPSTPPLLCTVPSAASGEFSFKSLPPGNYKLVPRYQNKDLTFEVKPSEVTFTVTNDSVLIEPTFEVHGFSVSGRVLNGDKKSGLSGAKVFLDGSLVAETDSKGQYQLFNITSGKYEIRVEFAEVEFDPVLVEVTPQSPLLPDISPSRYSVCGAVTITSKQKSTGHRVEATAQSLSKPISTTIKSDGTFCFMLPSGSYKVQVHIKKEDEENGIVLTPSEQTVTVKHSVVTDIKFNQFVTTLKGSVNCIVDCPPMEVRLQRMVRETAVGKPVTVTTSRSSKKATFVFSPVLPGTLSVSISHQPWCWFKDSQLVTVATKEPQPVTFFQKGFLVQLVSSHATDLDLSMNSKSISTVNVEQGESELCLEEPGVYNFLPNSCHNFEEKFYTFDVFSPQPVTLTALSHVVTVTVVSTVEAADIKMKTSSDENNEIILEPRFTIAPSKPSQDFVYTFSFNAKPGEFITAIPLSSTLICAPNKSTYTATKDCPERLPPFHCSPGLFIKGRVKPSLEGVTITVTLLQQDTQELLQVVTDKKGRYKAGPIHASTEHTVEAHKLQYAFEPLPDDRYSFKAMKFSQLTIEVEDEGTKTHLAGVLISITRDKMRSSNYTTEDGSVVFSNLVPGEYYVKPLLREYKFSPSSNMVTVEQGDTVVKLFTAKRVAFTCSGKVMSLNKTPLSGVTVAAVGTGTCGSYKEESISNSDGEYRFRGLMPDCKYKVSAIKGEERVVERALPAKRSIQISTGDVSEQNFIVFYQHLTVTVTGNVVTDSEYLNTLKVMVYDDEVHFDSPVYSTSLDSAGFFDIPNLPVNPNKTYSVSLETSLSSHLYRVNMSGKTDVTAESRKHITLHFSAEYIEMEPESSRGSFIGVILAVGVVFAVANFDKVMGVVQPYLAGLLNNNGDSRRR